MSHTDLIPLTALTHRISRIIHQALRREAATRPLLVHLWPNRDVLRRGVEQRDDRRPTIQVRPHPSAMQKSRISRMPKLRRMRYPLNH